MTDESSRAWELTKDIGFAMLITHDGEKLDARPMSATPDEEAGRIYFLTDARHHKRDEISRDGRVALSFAHPGNQKYVWVTGTAVLSNDRSKIKELFSLPAKAWWESADDPNIRLLTVMPEAAEYWDSPGTTISYVKMISAAVANTRPAVGENKKTNL